jgi:hypothetical protein
MILVARLHSPRPKKQEHCFICPALPHSIFIPVIQSFQPYLEVHLCYFAASASASIIPLF